MRGCFQLSAAAADEDMDGDDPIYVNCNTKNKQPVLQPGNFFKDGRTKIGRQQCVSCHQLTDVWQSALYLTCSGWPACRLRPRVGGSLAEEAAREGKEWNEQ